MTLEFAGHALPKLCQFESESPWHEKMLQQVRLWVFLLHMFTFFKLHLLAFLPIEPAGQVISKLTHMFGLQEDHSRTSSDALQRTVCGHAATGTHKDARQQIVAV